MSSSIQIPQTQLLRADGWAPDSRDISVTPGGSCYATTPGGTRIRWTRDQMLHFSNSPLAKSPLTLPVIPGITGPDVNADMTTTVTVKVLIDDKGQNANSDEAIFDMDDD